jgi:glutathione peroxidase
MSCARLAAFAHVPQPWLSILRAEYVQHALDIDGEDVKFSQFAGKVVLIVNVASACGYTEQNYRGLQALYEKYGQYGLEILAFPSNQFGGQEPGTDDHIKRFVSSRYGVTFRMMSKVDVNGEDTSPIFQYALLAAAC